MRQISVQTRLTAADYIFFLVVGVLFYLLNRFTPYPVSDDYVYRFISAIEMDMDKGYAPITSFQDVLSSQIYDYSHANGRFIVHCIVQAFCGIWGVEAFRVANTLVFLLLGTGLIKIFRLTCTYCTLDKYLLVFVLFVLLPAPGSLFWGIIAVSVNYLWTACAIVWLLYLYLKLKQDHTDLSFSLKICVGLAAVLVGSLQESFSIGISGALFLYYVYDYKRFIQSGGVKWLIIGFWIGTCFVVFAPGNFVRVGNGSFSFLKCVSRVVHSVTETRLFLLLLLSLVVYYIKSRQDCVNFVRRNLFWIYAILINILFAGLFAYTEKRQMTSVELFSIVLLYMLYFKAFINIVQRFYKGVLIGFIIFLNGLYIPVYLTRKVDYEKQIEVLSKIKDFSGRLFVSEEYQDYYMMNYNKWLYTHYVGGQYVYEHDDWYRYWTSLMASDGKNPRQLIMLPRTPEYIVEHCVQENCLQENVYQMPLVGDFYMTIIRVPEETDIEELDVYAWANPVNLFGKIRSEIFHTYSLNGLWVDKTRNFVKDGSRYVIMCQPFPIEKMDIKQL